MQQRPRVPVLQLAPWVDFGGTDKGTIDWFRWMDRERFALSLLTTQPSLNRRLSEVAPFADEVWALPELMDGASSARFVLDFIAGRGVRVVHIMNSRLGFELLPDIHALPNRPAVVVQLHVEEPERNGYVRYVATRFGNLVDAFSVSTPSLVESLVEYGITRDRIHVILTGIDVDDEFSPERIAPIDGLDEGVAHILFAARLVAQKDPLLAVAVADALRTRLPAFQLHVVGEGELEPELRRAVAERGLQAWIRMHAMSPEIKRWYVACDALLLTSTFEGVPFVVYEAMALGLPVVAPALNGILEIVAPDTGYVVEPRDDPEAYADALVALLGDRGQATAIGTRAREHMRAGFPVTRMAAAHAELYEDLLGAAAQRGGAPPPPTAAAPRPAPSPLRFAGRPSSGTPLVSIAIPCFNHGAWLLECIESLRAQTYSNIEIVVVDDASSDPDTVAVLERLERAPDVRVLRQELNSGPGAARNRAIRATSGRYVLPMDCDNMLLPRAVQRLVAQIQCAGEQVGFVYPNLRFFGNREDYFEAPDYNLDTLSRRNYCDTSSLIDRDVFDAGLWFPEGEADHNEDWRFFLGLGERDIFGEPARAETLLSRKHGFTRSERIDLTVVRPEQGGAGGAAARAMKARWSPAVSVVGLHRLRAGSHDADVLEARIAEQSCSDFEVLTWADGEPAIAAPAAVRRLPGRRGISAAQAIEEALRRARGRWIVVTLGTVCDPLENRAIVEQLLALFEDGATRGVAFADVGGHDLRPLGRDEAGGEPIHALAWETIGQVERLHRLELAPGRELEAITRALTLSGDGVEWRQLARAQPGSGRAHAAPLRLDLDQGLDNHALEERELRMAAPPARVRAPRPPRLPEGDQGWCPIYMSLLCRHRAHTGEGRLLNTSTAAVPGHDLERVLGLVRTQSPPGTVRISVESAGRVEVSPRGGSLDAGQLRRTLGYVEELGFSGLEALVRGRHAVTHEQILVCGEDDPLWAHLREPIERVGYIERTPINPPERARGASPHRVLGLVRTADAAARRHRYAVGAVAAGHSRWELGAVLETQMDGTRPLYLADDWAVLDGAGAPPRDRFSPVRALGWVVAPWRWQEFGRVACARAVLRRVTSLPQIALRPHRPPAVARCGRPVGWLLAEAGAQRAPLYAAIHPTTGDQLLTRYRVEALETGYGEPALIGYLIDRAPQTGSGQRTSVAIPWGSRFGTAVRWHLEPPEPA